MKIARWLLLGVLGTTGAMAQPASNITVRLYSTKDLKAVTIVPVAAVMRACSSCPLKLMPAQVKVGARGAQITVNGNSAIELEVDGQIRMTSDDGTAETGAGQWMITAKADGLHVLLTMPSERYVMAVLMSEANANEPIESLKALAVTARSFALTNLHRHGAEGLCDSTHCQALRIGNVPQAIENAVLATAGETLWWRGGRVPGYFTENCGGMTEDASAIWGGTQKQWLRAHQDGFCAHTPSQWHAELSGTELTDALRAEGWHLAGPVQIIHVTQRDSSGRAKNILLIAREEQLAITASTLRFAVNRSQGWNRLRSDWYEVSYSGGRVIFDGKGYGHGVGLCQAGATEMAKEGKNYREILAFYFPTTSVRVQSGDEGWAQQAGKGWMLRGVFGAGSDQASLVAAGDRALVKAHALFGADVHPVVTVYPTTELFRQATNEPGWMLAETQTHGRAVGVALQPLNVVRLHGGAETLLLHEFLHSMVESEAADTTPLWLREGLVEALAGEHGATNGMSAAEIDAALQRSRSQQENERAHDAACALVRQMIAKYGLQTVRSWLRSGVPHGLVTG
jgi:stage II sporulation protein D